MFNEILVATSNDTGFDRLQVALVLNPPQSMMDQCVRFSHQSPSPGRHPDGPCSLNVSDRRCSLHSMGYVISSIQIGESRPFLVFRDLHLTKRRTIMNHHYCLVA